MSTREGRVGQVEYYPDVNPPMGTSRVEILGMPLAMFIDLEGRTGLRTGDTITWGFKETP